MNTTRGTIFLTLILALAADPATSATISVTTSSPDGTPVMSLDVDRSNGSFGEQADGTQAWIGSLNNEVFGLTWDLFLDSDPGVSGSISVTNNSDSTQSFSMTTTVVSSIQVPAGATMKGGATISVADADFSNTPAALQSPAGLAVFTGAIDGASQKILLPSSLPGSFSLSSPGNGVNSAVSNFSGETTSTDLPVGGLLSLTHAFTLTPGDTATANSTFFVVPEPSTLGLLTLAMLLVFFVRR